MRTDYGSRCVCVCSYQLSLALECDVLMLSLCVRMRVKGVDITTMSANRGMICIGDADGFIHLANRQLETRKFQAHEHFVSHVVMVRSASNTGRTRALTPRD